MREITRIHLAKVPYEIEVDAKKVLEEYMSKLSQYIGDDEVVNDIEIRSTEILAERGVRSEGVIGLSDVEAIKSQIGSPEEIADESAVETVETSERKLYRDLDQSLLGGVVSGLAAYFKLDVVLLRVLFVILVIVTSGFALLVYAIMWLMVPAAKSSADKLRMQGKPVTIESISTINRDVNQSQRRRGELIRTTLLYLVGLGALLGAVGSLLAIVAATVSILSENLLSMGEASSAWYVAYGLAVLSGLLLAVLCGLVAYACFKRELPKRLLVAGTIIIIVGLTSFGSAIGIGMLGVWQGQSWVQSNVKETHVNLPANFDSVKVIEFNSNIPATVDYVVDNDTSMTLESFPGISPHVEIDGSTAKISLNGVHDNKLGAHQPALHIYGPALNEINIKGGIFSYANANQENLKINAATGARGLALGRVDAIESTTSRGSSIDLAGATISEVNLDLKYGSDVRLGNIGKLSVESTDVCPAEGAPASVRVASIVSGELQVNGTTESLRSFDSVCLEFIYGEGQ